MFNNFMKIKKWSFMHKALVACLAMFMVFIFISCQTVEPLDPELPISIEITNIPDANIGWSGFVGVHLVQGHGTSDTDPQLAMKVTSNVYSGLLSYKNGTEFKIKDVRLNTRYMAIFVMLQEGQTTVTRYSKEFIIKSGTIRLDFNKDSFSNPRDAINRYL